MADQIPFGVVEHILTKLGSKAFQEIGSMYGVPKEMTKLNGKLGTIKAVLLDAEEKQQQQSNRAVKDWVRRFRGVVYDADDLVDDYATHYLQRGGLGRQVSDFFSSENQVAFRLNMSHRLEDIKERIDDIAKEIPMLNLTPRDIVLHTRVENSGRDTHSFVLKSEMVLPNAITRLKNLQTLKLTSCRRLKRIPDNTGELINLRHLENDSCYNLAHMPHGIGKLTLLQSLPLFVVGNDIGLRNHKIGSLSELKGLNQLRGGLCISNLQNVRDVELVSRGGILKEKQYLQSLRLEWNRWGQDGGDEGDQSVMEGLQPHQHLKDIFIDGYGGTEFPSWMMNSLLPNLIKIEIWGCSRCKILPPFSQLPSLKSLGLHDMKEVVELKEGSLTTPLFPSLESLELSFMPKLKELWRMDLLAEEGPSFSHLSQLKISYCHNLASLELHSSPSLSQLEIHYCPNLTSLELPSSLCLSNLYIGYCPNLASLELHSSPCLSRLEIRECPNLASFKVAPLPYLETLSLFTVRYGVIWQIMSVSASLKFLYIESIDDMISLPKELLQHVSGLVTLQIRECPNLQSLELPSSPSLSELRIINCPNLASFNVASLPRLEKLSLRGVRAEVLRQLIFVSASSSLKSLRIREIDGMISLPEEPLQYVSTLETLYIVKCSGLATLLHWMGSLSSLTELIIYDCSELTSLPEEICSLKKLQKFYFCDYPHLEKRYNKETEIRECPNLASFKVAPLPYLETLSLFTVRYGVIWQIMSVSASLKSLYIGSIDDMISLQKDLLQHVSGLVTLQIRECPNLQSLELPSSPSLSELRIINCPNLASFNVASLPRLEKLSLRGVRAEVLRQFMFVSASSSLKSLRIREIDGMISLPEEPLQYVSTLETLYIVKCSGLATLLHWMGSLSSLTELIIYDCSELTSLPEEIYSLKKLQKFYFCDYPDLEERYNKETGKDRAKIAHIPHVRFNSDLDMYGKTQEYIGPHLVKVSSVRRTISKFVEEKKDLIQDIPKDRKISKPPKIAQPTLIIWGDQDKVFLVELAHKLKRHFRRGDPTCDHRAYFYHREAQGNI
ncbi:hypothetical protein VitviT2T_030626 [Vitis vinifera]|uniref:Rx N-terminal domain-containing protein n=1 Tax=Vitis vinifera TaxID=29760 RepID=A0ABY9E0N0_VITVI|nr:hypothetical protein VitviT2T_030626 [Vitis vinifera]